MEKTILEMIKKEVERENSKNYYIKGTVLKSEMESYLSMKAVTEYIKWTNRPSPKENINFEQWFRKNRLRKYIIPDFYDFIQKQDVLNISNLTYEKIKKYGVSLESIDILTKTKKGEQGKILHELYGKEDNEESITELVDEILCLVYESFIQTCLLSVLYKLTLNVR